jgi:oligopeptidase A
MEQEFDSWSVLSHMHSVSDNKNIRNYYQKTLPKINAYYTKLYQNQNLYKIIELLSKGEVTTIQKRSLDIFLQDLKLSGASLNSEDRNSFFEIKQTLSALSTKFSNNVLDATNSWNYATSDINELDGLPSSSINLFMDDRKTESKFNINLRGDTYLSIMRYAKNDTLRNKIHKAYSTRASELFDNKNFDNSEISLEILQNRLKLASLLGYKNYSQLSIANKMVDSENQVVDFLTDLAKLAKPAAIKEYEQLQEFAKNELGIENLQPHDITYCSEKLKEKLHNIDEEKLKEYFPLERVINGMFHIATSLFNVTFKAYKTTTWNDKVKVFQLLDNKEKTIGFVYMDLFSSSVKRGGAWLNDIQNRVATEDNTSLPVAYLACNFTPSEHNLLYHYEVETIFHEFGHSLHQLLTQVDIGNISGINSVEWDAVELPSQLFENWCRNKQTIPLISEHYQTKAKLSDEMLDSVINANNFQSALQMLRQIEFSLFDFKLHQEISFDKETIQKFLNQTRSEISVIPQFDYNRFAHSFSHIFAGGYSAGYYSYKWAEVLSSNVFALFEKDMLSKEMGQKYLDNFLSCGASKPAMEMFLNLCPKIDKEQFLKYNGIE